MLNFCVKITQLYLQIKFKGNTSHGTYTVIHTLNWFKMRQLEGKLTKSSGKHHEGYPLQSRTLKLLGRCWRTSEYIASLIISILKLFISLKILSLKFSKCPRGKLSNIMTSILSFPFPNKSMLKTSVISCLERKRSVCT